MKISRLRVMYITLFLSLSISAASATENCEEKFSLPPRGWAGVAAWVGGTVTAASIITVIVAKIKLVNVENEIKILKENDPKKKELLNKKEKLESILNGCSLGFVGGCGILTIALRHRSNQLKLDTLKIKHKTEEMLLRLRLFGELGEEY